MDPVEPESENDDGASAGGQGNDSGPRLFRCAVCGRGFARRDKLERHSRVHSGEKPFLCFECGRAFARRDKLIRHRKEVHTGERPFRCELCSRTFARRDTLRTHARIHNDREATRPSTPVVHQSAWVPVTQTSANCSKIDS